MQYSNQPWHSGIGYASTVTEWWPTDTRESFERMIQNPDHREYFRSQGWLESGAITYRFNKQGFRGDEFDASQPTLLALGCSFTMGIGLPEHQTWPWLVGKELGLRVATVAHGGWSSDACFRLAEYWVPTLMPKLVVMLTPPQHRLEIHTGDPGFQVENIMHSQSPWDTDRYIKCWFSNDENSRLNSLKNKLALEKLCENAGVPCLTYDANRWFARSREEVGYARDYMHAGPVGHQMVKEQILNDQARIRHSIS